MQCHVSYMYTALLASPFQASSHLCNDNSVCHYPCVSLQCRRLCALATALVLHTNDHIRSFWVFLFGLCCSLLAIALACGRATCVLSLCAAETLSVSGPSHSSIEEYGLLAALARGITLYIEPVLLVGGVLVVRKLGCVHAAIRAQFAATAQARY